MPHRSVLVSGLPTFGIVQKPPDKSQSQKLHRRRSSYGLPSQKSFWAGMHVCVPKPGITLFLTTVKVTGFHSRVVKELGLFVCFDISVRFKTHQTSEVRLCDLKEVFLIELTSRSLQVTNDEKQEASFCWEGKVERMSVASMI